MSRRQFGRAIRLSIVVRHWALTVGMLLALAHMALGRLP